MPKMKISENENSHKNTFSKNEVARLKIVACSVLTDVQTNKQKSKDRGSPFRAFRVTCLSPSSRSGPIIYDLSWGNQISAETQWRDLICSQNQ